MSAQNPYAPPVAPISDSAGTSGEPTPTDRFDPHGRHRGALHGWGWYKAAWQIYRTQPFKWWLVLFILFGATIAASLIPFLNLLTSALFPILTAGIGACATSTLRDGQFTLGQVFDGFRRRPGVLLLAGALYLAVNILLLGIVALVFDAHELISVFTGGLARQKAAQAMFASRGAGFILAYFGAMTLGMSTVTFAPYLIHEHGLSAPKALLASTRGIFMNIPACLVALLSYVMLAIGATIPLLLGWLVLIPVLVLTGFAAYRDVFVTAE